MKNSYATQNEAKIAVMNHANNIGVNIKWKKNEYKLLYAVCRSSKNCPFTIYISRDAKEGKYILRKYVGDYIHAGKSDRHLMRGAERISSHFNTLLRDVKISSTTIIKQI